MKKLSFKRSLCYNKRYNPVGILSLFDLKVSTIIYSSGIIFDSKLSFLILFYQNSGHVFSGCREIFYRVCSDCEMPSLGFYKKAIKRRKCLLEYWQHKNNIMVLLLFLDYAYRYDVT